MNHDLPHPSHAAATAAVLVVVVLGSIATYLVAYNSLVGSIDVSLSGEAHALLESLELVGPRR